MGRTHVVMIEELGRNVEHLAGLEARRKVMQGSDSIVASSSKEKVARWVKGAIERMDASVDERTRTRIMENCGYSCASHNKRTIDSAKKRRMRFNNLDEFIAAEQKKPMAGTRLSREGTNLYWYFTPHSFTRPMRCFCGLLRGLPEDENISRTYCNCSKGFVQKYWEAILGKPVQVDLEQSVVSGSKECKFSIHL